MDSLKFKLLIVFFLCQPLLANSIELVAVRVERGPILDGYLDDEVWQKVVPFEKFRMVEPIPDSEPSVKTELRIIYDQDDLYLGIHCYDPDHSLIVGNSMAHDDADSDRPNDDLIRVLLDPFQDKRTAYLFFVNPCGARSEGLAFGEHSSMDWDGIWDAQSKILPDGWSTEIKIPFRTISFNPKLTKWGLNVERYIPRKMETIRLSGFTPERFFNNPSEAALLVGIENIKQGKGITFRPYGITSSMRDYEGAKDRQLSLDGGFDIYKNFTPNFVGAFSFNTDFAETEADERQINLTRFPLYFPEKRTFFLEGSEIFNFGAGSDSFSPFYSRRIGLYQDQQVPISFGTKLFGKLGNTSIALLDVQTRKSSALGLDGQNFFAGRIYQNIWEQSKVGVIFTNGNPSGQGNNSLTGIDFTFNTSRFHGDKNLSLRSWCVYNWNSSKGSHYGYGLGIDYPNDLWDVGANYAHYGDALLPGLGYIRRTGTKILSIYAAFQPRPKKGLIAKWVRQFFFEFCPTVYWDMSGNIQTWQLFTAPLNLRSQRGEHIEFNIIPNHDVLPADFEVAKGVIIPAGAYDFVNYRFEYSTPAYHALAFELSYRFGDFYSGTYRDATLGLALRLKGHANISLNFNLVHGSLEQGTFNEHVYQLKADFYLSPKLGLLNYIQYDDISKTLGVNIRFRWEINPGNQVYLVFTKNWERRWEPQSSLAPLGEWLVFKIQLNWRP